MNTMESIVIIGAPRSGTTLLAGLIANNPMVAPYMPECTFITRVIEQYYAILKWSDKERFGTYQKDSETHLEMYKTLVNKMLQNSKECHKAIYKYYVYKDPYLTKWINLIPLFFGSKCRILAVIRDPRSIISSYLKIEQHKKREKHKWTGKIKKIFFNKRIIKLTAEIIEYFNHIHNNQNGSTCLIQYEKLCAQQQEEILKVNKFLGFELNNAKKWRLLFPFNSEDPTFSEKYGNEINNNSRQESSLLSFWDEKYIKKQFSSFNEKYTWW